MQVHIFLSECKLLGLCVCLSACMRVCFLALCLAMLLFLLQTVTSTSRSDYNRQLGGYEREREVEKVKMQKEREKKEAQRQISAFFYGNLSKYMYSRSFWLNTP